MLEEEKTRAVICKKYGIRSSAVVTKYVPKNRRDAAFFRALVQGVPSVTLFPDKLIPSIVSQGFALTVNAFSRMLFKDEEDAAKARDTACAVYRGRKENVPGGDAALAAGKCAVDMLLMQCCFSRQTKRNVRALYGIEPHDMYTLVSPRHTEIAHETARILNAHLPRKLGVRGNVVEACIPELYSGVFFSLVIARLNLVVRFLNVGDPEDEYQQCQQKNRLRVSTFFGRVYCLELRLAAHALDSKAKDIATEASLIILSLIKSPAYAVARRTFINQAHPNFACAVNILMIKAEEHFAEAQSRDEAASPCAPRSSYFLRLTGQQREMAQHKVEWIVEEVNNSNRGYLDAQPYLHEAQMRSFLLLRGSVDDAQHGVSIEEQSKKAQSALMQSTALMVALQPEQKDNFVPCVQLAPGLLLDINVPGNCSTECMETKRCRAIDALHGVSLVLLGADNMLTRLEEAVEASNDVVLYANMCAPHFFKDGIVDSELLRTLVVGCIIVYTELKRKALREEASAWAHHENLVTPSPRRAVMTAPRRAVMKHYLMDEEDDKQDEAGRVALDFLQHVFGAPPEEKGQPQLARQQPQRVEPGDMQPHDPPMVCGFLPVFDSQGIVVWNSEG